MKIHRELKIQCREEDLASLGSEIQKHLPDGWERDEKAEKSLKNDVYYCFASTSRPNISKAQVWLTYSSEQKSAWVANILPISSPSLGIEEYNRVVADFYHNAVRPASERLGFQSSLSEEEVDAAHWGVSQRSVDLLRAFSSSANKSTGSAHPLDRKRWYDFLISVHKDQADLDVTSLGQMLIENYGWSDSVASDLRLEYEFALGLLGRYDESGR